MCHFNASQHNTDMFKIKISINSDKRSSLGLN